MTAPTREQVARQATLGLRDIAVLLDVADRTPASWQYRTRQAQARGEKIEHPFPEADEWVSSNRPVWRRATVLRWAAEAGKLPTQRGTDGTVKPVVDVALPEPEPAPATEAKATEAKAAARAARARKKVTARDLKQAGVA